MMRTAVGLSLSMLLQAGALMAQGGVFRDSVPTAPRFHVYQYTLDVPVGQTFVQGDKSNGWTRFRSSGPDPSDKPIVMMDSSGGNMRTVLHWGGKSHQVSSTEVSQTSNGQVTQYRIRGSVSTDADPSRYIVDMYADKAQRCAYDLRLGYGSTRLDLSGLNTESVNVVTASADVIIGYRRANAGRMRTLRIQGGMSEIILRHIELARAEEISVDNGMGQTRIMLGNHLPCSSQIRVSVGAGSCILVAHEEVPLRIILDQTVFSTVEIPSNFKQVSENVLVNSAWEAQQGRGATIRVELGIGSFTLIPFR